MNTPDTPRIDAKASGRSFTLPRRQLTPAQALIQVGPFLGAATLGLIVGWLSAESRSTGAYLLSLLFTMSSVAVTTVTFRARSKGWTRILGSILYLVAVALLEYSQGGSRLDYSILMLIPVIWVALYRPMHDVFKCLLAMVVLLIVPIAAVGSPQYPSRSWIHALLLTMVAMTVGTTLNALVKRTRGESKTIADTVDSALDAFASCDASGRVLIWNDQAEVMFGWTAEEIIGRQVTTMAFAPEVFSEISSMLQFDAADPEDRPRIRIERSVVRRDGSSFIASLAINVVNGDRGFRYNVFANDVTETRRIESALAASEQLLRVAFDSAPIGMVLATLDGRLERVNSAMCELVGFERSELEGATVASVIHPEDQPLALDQLRELANGGPERATNEIRICHKDGHTIWVQSHRTLVSESDGISGFVLAQIIDITSRREHDSQLQHLADHDPLTGLFNRRAFSLELQRHLAESDRHARSGALLALDLDGFKYINDTLGHEAGDELIIEVARVLKGRLRECDTLARIGGDEFAILLPRANRAGASTVAESLLRTLRSARFTGSRANRPVTVSIGVAEFGDDVTAEQAMVNADLAMYDAKELGRNRVSVFSGDEQREPRIRTRLSWMQKIDAAFENDGFALEAMPIVDVQTGAIDQYELLLRMRDDAGGLIAPALFLDVAERFDVIHKIDQWVTMQAVRMLGENPSFPYGLAVNLSGKSIADPELILSLRSELRVNSVDPSRLTFELTETAAVADVLLARQVADSLHKLGCKFALDDFGAGFGSFSYLKHLPFDYIKIDGEFVKDCATDHTNQLIIASLVGIARGLGRHTVGEYTSDAETLETLRRFGVDFAQGFHIGQPIPIDEILTTFAAIHPVTF
jgi:diguanylate cyclase (GGDEF)-like protein/PAS domain S-box-containing protein